MEDYLRAVERSLESENWHAAISLALTLPDICARLEDPNTRNGKAYLRWFEGNLLREFTRDAGGRSVIFLTGKDCYALRCAFLHAGSDDISDQNIREALTKFHFCTTGTHLVRLNRALILDVREFCTTIVAAVRNWRDQFAGDEHIQARIKDLARVETGAFNPFPGAIVR